VKNLPQALLKIPLGPKEGRALLRPPLGDITVLEEGVIMEKIARKIIARLPQPLRKGLFFGWAHYCPICQSHVRKLLAVGPIPRPNAKCPVCGSLERHRLVWLFFKQRTNLFDPSPKRMLHIAPERIFVSKFTHIFNIDYLTADLNDPSAMVKMDITNIQYPDDSFDVIYCSHVLEHVSEDRKAMRELNRVLKPDGWMVLLVPLTTKITFEPSSSTPAERKRLFGHSEHVRSYGPDFKDRLEEAGFIVKVFSAVEIIGVNDLPRMSVPYSEIIFFCTKR